MAKMDVQLNAIGCFAPIDEFKTLDVNSNGNLVDPGSYTDRIQLSTARNAVIKYMRNNSNNISEGYMALYDPLPNGTSRAAFATSNPGNTQLRAGSCSGTESSEPECNRNIINIDDYGVPQCSNWFLAVSVNLSGSQTSIIDSGSQRSMINSIGCYSPYAALGFAPGTWYVNGDGKLVKYDDLSEPSPVQLPVAREAIIDHMQRKGISTGYMALTDPSDNKAYMAFFDLDPREPVFPTGYGTKAALNHYDNCKPDNCLINPHMNTVDSYDVPNCDHLFLALKVTIDSSTISSPTPPPSDNWSAGDVILATVLTGIVLCMIYLLLRSRLVGQL